MIVIILKQSFKSIFNRWRLYIFNILSLTICSLTLLLAFNIYLSEHQINTTFSRSNRIYRISTNTKFESSEQDLATSLAFIGPSLYSSLPEIELYTQFIDSPIKTFSLDESTNEIEARIVEVDTNFFSVFDFQKQNRLRIENNRANISIELEKKLPKKKIINETILYGGNPLIIENIVDPLGTDFDYDIYVPLSERSDFDWVQTYVVIRDNYTGTLQSLEEKINKLALEKLSGEFDEEAMELKFKLESLENVHFSKKLYDSKVPVSKEIISLLIIVALMLFLLASLNHINLFGSIKNSSKSEMSVRRAYGATKTQIGSHFIVESVLLYLISLAVSISLILTIDVYKLLGITGIEIHLFPISVYILLLLLFLFLGCVSGIFVLLLHYSGIFYHNSNIGSIRTYKILLVAQLSLALVAICNQVSASNQLSLIKNYDLGFTVEDIIVIKGDINMLRALQNDISSLSSIEYSSLCEYNSIPGNEPEIQIWEKSSSKTSKGFPALVSYVDSNYFKVLNIGVEKSVLLKKGTVLVNKSMIQQGIRINDLINRKQVIGFAENTVNRGFYKNPDLQVYAYDSSKFNAVMLKYKGNRDPIVEHIESFKDQNFQDTQVTIQYLPDMYYNEYKQFYRISEIISVISIAILIVSMFGLYTTGRLLYKFNSKEYSIRYFLGSTKFEFRKLHMERLIKLVLISTALSIPAAILSNEVWLSEFAIKSSLSLMDFLIIVIGYITCAITISMIILFTTKMNPLSSIKNNLQNV